MDRGSIVGDDTEGFTSFTLSATRKDLLAPILEEFKRAVLPQPFSLPSLEAKYNALSAIGAGMKLCRKCGEIKPVEEFRKFAGKKWRSYRCRECERRMNRDAYQRRCEVSSLEKLNNL
jgi:hypothetical protein